MQISSVTLFTLIISTSAALADPTTRPVGFTVEQEQALRLAQKRGQAIEAIRQVKDLQARVNLTEKILQSFLRSTDYTSIENASVRELLALRIADDAQLPKDASTDRIRKILVEAMARAKAENKPSDQLKILGAYLSVSSRDNISNRVSTLGGAMQMSAELYHKLSTMNLEEARFFQQQLRVLEQLKAVTEGEADMFYESGMYVSDRARTNFKLMDLEFRAAPSRKESVDARVTFLEQAEAQNKIDAILNSDLSDKKEGSEDASPKPMAPSQKPNSENADFF